MDVFLNPSWQYAVTHFCLCKAYLDSSLCAVLHHETVASKDLVNPNLLHILYLAAVACSFDCVFTEWLWKMKELSLSLAGAKHSTAHLLLCLYQLWSWKQEKKQGVHQARHQVWKCPPSWAAGLVPAHSSHSHPSPPTPLASPDPSPCSTKLFCPQLIYSPWGQRLCPVVCNKARFIVLLSSALQFSWSPWQPSSIP